MAQVHFAVLKESGDHVAIKVQRPGIEKTIDADFDILMWFARQAHERIEELKPYDLPGVVDTLRKGLERELDFRFEARSMAFSNFRIRIQKLYTLRAYMNRFPRSEFS